jgi:hypothetical protein
VCVCVCVCVGEGGLSLFDDTVHSVTKFQRASPACNQIQHVAANRIERGVLELPLPKGSNIPSRQSPRFVQLVLAVHQVVDARCKTVARRRVVFLVNINGRKTDAFAQGCLQIGCVVSPKTATESLYPVEHVLESETRRRSYLSKSMRTPIRPCAGELGVPCPATACGCGGCSRGTACGYHVYRRPQKCSQSDRL